MQTDTMSQTEFTLWSKDLKRSEQALAQAKAAGARDPLRYALSLIRNPNWSPTSGSVRSNAPIRLNGCMECGGDRLVLVTEPDPKQLYSEIYTRCPACNPGTP